MKNFFLLLFALCLFGCGPSIYHVASIQSDQVKLVDNDFVYENDDLKVIYNLWDEGGRMRFLLFNKTDRLLSVDWSKSFLERNGFVTVYSQESTVPHDRAQYIYQKAEIDPLRRTAQTERIAQIPSHTFVAIADLPIQHINQSTNPPQNPTAYPKENSPLQLTHQLTYSLNGSRTTTKLIENSFWADTVRAVNPTELTRLFGSLAYGRPNALYALRHQPEKPVRVRSNVVRRRLPIGALGILAFIFRLILVHRY